MKKYIYYCSVKNRLIHYSQVASPDYWDQHWKKNSQFDITNIRLNQWVVSLTQKYIPVPGRVIEGGCGIGDKVYSLLKSGYNTYGVDFALETIQQSRRLIPELGLACQDVRNLGFPDHIFDGYWSLGVIEHFNEGFQAIADEMNRVLKPGGFLFLTVPIISPLRQIKITLNHYPTQSHHSIISKDFYQYMYSQEEIIQEFTNRDFNLVKTRLQSGLKGLKDEISILKPLLQKIYNGNHLINRIAKHFFEKGLSWFSGHSRLFIFQKNLIPSSEKSSD